MERIIYGSGYLQLPVVKIESVVQKLQEAKLDGTETTISSLSAYQSSQIQDLQCLS